METKTSFGQIKLLFSQFYISFTDIAGIDSPKLSMSKWTTSDPHNYGQLWAGGDNIVKISKG